MVDGCGFFKHLRVRIWAFAADWKGSVLPFVAISVTSLIGFAMLATDIPRYVDLQTQLQKGADAFALAGAAELDGRTDAITRANTAIDTLLAGTTANSSIFGPGRIPVTVSSRNYYAALPATDNLAMGAALGNSKAEQTTARFVQVVATPVTVPALFPVTLQIKTASNNMTTTAVAVAGFTEVVCQFTPLFICNPFEGSDPTKIYDNANIGKEFLLKQGPGGTTPYAPGNYGFLEPNKKPGAKDLRDALAAKNPGACFAQNGVTTEPGNVASASDAVNVRFDVYDGSASGYKDADHPPALNVRKGCLSLAANTCDENPNGYNNAPGTTKYCNNYNNVAPPYNKPPPPPTRQAPAYAMPEDSVVDAITGLGNGFWDEGEYWLANHPTVANPYGCVAGTPCNTVSRYTVYIKEIGPPSFLTGAANTSLGKNALGWTDPKKPTGEVGAPQCNKISPPVGLDRRILYAAIINCSTADAGGPLKGGKANGVPVYTYAKFFFIAPVDKTQNIEAEFEGILKRNDPNDNGVLHDIVQLVR